MVRQVRRGAAAVKVQYRSASGEAVDTTLDRAALAELTEALPVREFRWHQGQKHYSGWYWSSTMQGHVVYESRLELARILLADLDPDVTAIASQPFRLIGANGTRIFRHVPDILLEMSDGGVMVVDVKSPDKRGDPNVKALMEWTRHTVGLRGWAFEEWYGAPIDLVANVRFLAGYRRRSVIDETLIPAVRDAASGPMAVTDLERSVTRADPVLIRPVIMHLLWSGELATDLTRPLDGLSIVAPRLSGKAG
jgi:hypothetical protein